MNMYNEISTHKISKYGYPGTQSNSWRGFFPGRNPFFSWGMVEETGKKFILWF